VSEKKLSTHLSRRQFVKAGAASVCAFCLSGVAGCAPARSEPQEQAAGGAQIGLVKPVPSPWFTQAKNYTVQCQLCPRECSLAEGERSPCRVRENRGGVGYTLTYGNPALVQEDPVERKPFYHVLPGSRVLSISTAGCNLYCHFCEAWDIALVKPEEVHNYELPPEKVVAHALASGVRAVSYAFGEPAAFFEYMASTAVLAKEAGLLNLAHTAGYFRPEPLRKLCRSLDAVNVDLKSFDPAFYRNVVGGELTPVLENLKLLRDEGVHLEITNIVIPTLNDDLGLIKEMCRWIADELGTEVPLHFSRFYPLFRLSTLPQTPVSTLEQAREAGLQAGLKYVYIAKVIGHKGENTFCPGCGQKVIKRIGFVIAEINLENGACKYCGATVSGLWQ
jgi:pyruvate formate lyase activating enzyme